MIQFQRLFLRAAALLSLGLVPSGCSEAAPPPEEKQAPQSRRTATTAPQVASRFIRFVDDGDGEGRLETAIVTYLGPRGQRVDLVSAVHVADRVYYEKLQELFEVYDAVLYEMVKPKRMKPQGKNRRRHGLISFFQRGLKNVLDLEFQLDGLDYMRPNFVHADLDVETFNKLSKDRGENIVALLFKSMEEHHRKQRKEKDKGSDAAPRMKFGDLIEAFMSKDSSRLLKHVLARQLHEVEKALAGLSKGQGSVILTERNKKCIEVLEERLEKGDKKLGIFYGGAHMPDLEKRMLTELGFRRLEQRWLTAWDIKKAAAASRPASRPGK